MFSKKTICTLSAGALLATAVPALAEGTAERDWADERRARVASQHRAAVVERRVVERRTFAHQEPAYYGRRHGHVNRAYAPASARYYTEAPAPYYAHQSYYAEPAYAYSRDNTAGIIGGAAIGAAIGSQVGHGHDRAAATAIGALLGGLIGGSF